MTRPTVFHPGDVVRFIREPRFVERVGYEVDYASLRGAVDGQTPARTPALMAAVSYYLTIFKSDFEGLWRDVLATSTLNSNEREFLTSALKILAIRRVIDRQQGHERRLFFTEPDVFWRPEVTMDVLSKRVVQTGTHYGSSGAYDDVEPGGLAHRQTHVLLRTHWGEVLATDVEKIS